MNIDATTTSAESNSNNTPDTNIYVGDTVKVKPGVRDPDIRSANEDGQWWDDVSLAGWVAIVTDIEEGNDGREFVTLEWDSETLGNVPKRWLNFCAENFVVTGEEFGFMVLGAEEVELTEARDTAADRLKARNRIQARFEWKECLEELCDAVGLSKDDDDDGRITWTIMELHEDGDAMAIGPEQQGLTLLKRAHQTHTLEFLPGDYRVNGQRVDEALKTVICIAVMQQKKMPALLVRAHWTDFDINGDDVELQHDVIVGLTPRS